MLDSIESLCLTGRQGSISRPVLTAVDARFRRKSMCPVQCRMQCVRACCKGCPGARTICRRDLHRPVYRHYLVTSRAISKAFIRIVSWTDILSMLNFRSVTAPVQTYVRTDTTLHRERLISNHPGSDIFPVYRLASPFDEFWNAQVFSEHRRTFSVYIGSESK